VYVDELDCPDCIAYVKQYLTYFLDHAEAVVARGSSCGTTQSLGGRTVKLKPIKKAKWLGRQKWFRALVRAVAIRYGVRI
jgi:hypothetical protein